MSSHNAHFFWDEFKVDMIFHCMIYIFTPCYNMIMNSFLQETRWVQYLTFQNGLRFFFESLATHFVTNINPNIGKLPINKYGNMARKTDGWNNSIISTIIYGIIYFCSLKNHNRLPEMTIPCPIKHDIINISTSKIVFI